tara:strand:- start:2463 stop:2681 length:219 start_codon:yes stop_codon:yes gene_type:complete
MSDITRADLSDLRDDIHHLLKLVNKMSIKIKKQQEQINELMQGEMILGAEIGELAKKIIKEDWKSKLGDWSE